MEALETLEQAAPRAAMTRGARTPGTDRLERWLRESGVEFQIFEHEPVRTSEEAARVRGTPLDQRAKALVVRAEDRHVQGS